MSEWLFEAIRDNILQQHLDDRKKVHLTLTSKEHANGSVQSGPYTNTKYGIPVKAFLKRNDCVHTLFESLDDELCCARAIVTATEYVDGDPDKQYRNLRDGRPIKKTVS